MADKRTSKLPIKDDGPVFPLFKRLPWEIRHMIWEQALPPPIPQVLVYRFSTFPRWDATTSTWDATDGPPRIHIPPPALLHATRESRKFTLEHVLVREEEHYMPTKLKRIVSRPFDREKDALFIPAMHFDDFIMIFMGETPWAARHLVFDDQLYENRRFLPGHCDWHDFESAADRWGRGIRSIALANPCRCDWLLWNEGFHDSVVKGYYRVVPDEEIMAPEHGVCEILAAEFRGRQGPDGIPWKVRVGSGRLCGADGGQDEEDLLECSQVILERFTALTMDQD